MEPYIPGEQPKDKKYIKLNTNENPYPPSPKVLESLRAAADPSLRLYPDPTCDELRTQIGRFYSLRKENVFLGNGSDEVLAFCFLAFFNPEKPILFPDVTYSFYPVYAQLFKINYESVPLDDHFSLPVERFLTKNGGVIFPNPNAPTGKYLSLDHVKTILVHNPDSVVIIDEAYIDFGGASAVSLMRDFPNLLVVQTFSKSRSLAGLRIGFALGHEDLIAGLDRVKNSFNSYTLDRLALIGAREAIKDEAYFHETRNKIIQTREKVSAHLRKLGFQVVPSQANFIFATHAQVKANALFQHLRDRGVLVRYFNKPRIDNYLRITIGTDAEMAAFLQKAAEIISFLGS